MPVTVVIGGQYGSEGKGKVAHFLAKEMGAAAVIRVGGPNSGHTAVTPKNEAVIFQQLPTAALWPDVLCVIPPGSYLDSDRLLHEIRSLDLPHERLVVDQQAHRADDGRLARVAARRLGVMFSHDPEATRENGRA